METNSLYQLITEPTNISNESMPYIDLIITDKTNMFVDYGVHPPLDIHCQDQIIFGNLNLPSPSSYSRTVSYYSRTNAQSIINSLNSVNWVNDLNTLGPSEMLDYFNSTLYKIMSIYIPNKSIKICYMDQPWLTHEQKTAIKQKHRVYDKFLRHGRNKEDWAFVWKLQFENTKKIIEAKNTKFFKLGKKLSGPHIAVNHIGAF